MTQKRRVAREALYWVLMAALLTAGGFLLFTNLGGAAISDCDEARHGINAYEMLESGDWVVSTYRGETDYWNLKPPLTYYCIALGYELFGFNALGMRFYSALSMLLVMVVMALWMKRRYGSVASLVCQLFWLGCAMVYGPHFARFGDADAQMLLFYVIAMLCMVDSRRDMRRLYGSAVCFGLAFLSKSWHAALIPVTCLIYLLATGEIRRLKLGSYLLLVVCGLAPIAPWAAARYARDGMTFFETMLTVDVATRATTVHEGHFGGALYYVEYLLRDPAVVVAAAVCLVALVMKLVARTRIRADQWGVAMWFFVPLVFYSLCVSKLSWYIFVSLPGLAVALGMGGRRLCAGLRGGGPASVARVCCVAAACALLGYCAAGSWQQVSATVGGDRYQRLISDNFDREFDAGTRIYVQYESENSYYPTDYRCWVQDDLLAAMLVGGLECMDGGIDAFLEEEEHAYLICHQVGMDWDILGEYPIVAEDGPLMLVENLN